MDNIRGYELRDGGSIPSGRTSYNATLAHLVEHRREESGVLGSSPRGCTNKILLICISSI